MIIKSATKLAEANTAAEQALRVAICRISDARQALQDCASDPEVNKLGKYNIDTADFRMRLAGATMSAEDAHTSLCINHEEFNKMAKLLGIDTSGAVAGTVTTKDGGGR